MAESNSAEKINSDYVEYCSTDVMTGGQDKRKQLYQQLVNSLKRAESVDIIVSFLMESGVKRCKNQDSYWKLFGNHTAFGIVFD